jgi:hypothetical protein
MTYTTKIKPDAVFTFYKKVLPKNGWVMYVPDDTDANGWLFFYGPPPPTPNANGEAPDSPGPYIQIHAETIAPAQTQVVVRYYPSD